MRSGARNAVNALPWVSEVLEQQVVDHGLVLVGDVSDGRRQREHHLIVGHRKELGFSLGEPLPRRRALALRAMPVTAGIVGDERV